MSLRTRCFMFVAAMISRYASDGKRCVSCVPSGFSTTSEKTTMPPVGAERTILCFQSGWYSGTTMRIASSRQR